MFQYSYKEKIFALFALLTLLICFILFAFIFGVVAIKFASNNLNIFSGESNLIYQTLGSLIVVLVAIPIMIFFATLLALWRVDCFWQKRSKLNNSCANVFDVFLLVLHSVPSIVWGILGFALFVKGIGLGKSWFAGSLTLAFLGFPFLLETALARGKQISKETILAAEAVGSSRPLLWQYVLLPPIFLGILTGLRLTVPRIFGETAPILLTASVFSGVFLPKGIVNEPVLTLPYHMYVLAQDVFSETAMQSAWNSAFVLIFVSLCLRFFTSFVQQKLEKRWML